MAGAAQSASASSAELVARIPVPQRPPDRDNRQPPRHLSPARTRCLPAALRRGAGAGSRAKSHQSPLAGQSPCVVGKGATPIDVLSKFVWRSVVLCAAPLL